MKFKDRISPTPNQTDSQSSLSARRGRHSKSPLKMKVITVSLICLLLVSISTITYFISDHLVNAANPQSSKPLNDYDNNVVIYLVPHADDETLTFGIPILNDIHDGKKVYLILLTNGVGSYARDILNGKSDAQSSKYHASIVCPIHHVVHNPLKEHYLDPWITNAVLERVRNEEFIEASMALGVPRNHLELMAMSRLPYTSVRDVVLKLKQRFPDATFKSMSPLDGHTQHAITGEVLAGMYEDHELYSIQNNFGSIYTDRIEHQGLWPGQKIHLENPRDRAKLLRAIYAYTDWDPRHGKYAIGYHSVPVQFDMLRRNMYTKIFYLRQQ